MGTQSGVAGTLDVSIVGNAGQLPIPVGAIAVAASNVGANSIITVNLPAAAGKTTYISGLQITAAGATAASVVQATVYLAGSAVTMYYVYAVPAGTTALGPTVVLTFPNPVSAGAVNAVVQIILPALGSGNTNAAVSAQGYQL